MSTFKKTLIKSHPKIGEKITQDSLYWKHLDFPITRKNFGGVTHIDVCAGEPRRYAVTSGAKVEIYDADSHEVHKTFSRFRRTAYSGTLRADGRLMVAGGEEGLVRLFDVDGKALLRTFKGHKRAVHVTRFCSDNLRVLSGGDDNTVRLYDVPSERAVTTYNEHQDYIRGGAVSKASSDIVLTGSYDHTARLFDTRMRDSVLVLKHGCPVESVLVHPGGSLLYTAGGETIKVWDALAGGRLVASVKNHHKTITAMCFCTDNKRLVSAGLDRHVKIYDVSSYQVVHSIDYMSALLSVAIPSDDAWVTVGMTDGHLITQRRRDPAEVLEAKRRKREKKKSSYKFSMGAKVYEKQEGDAVIKAEFRERMEKYDQHLRKFNYSKALTTAMETETRKKTPEVTFGVIQELIRRDGLSRALAGRDEKQLITLIGFLVQHIPNEKFIHTAIDVSTVLLDTYQSRLTDSHPLSLRLKNLKAAVDKELALIKELYEVSGIVETIMAASQRGETLALPSLNSQGLGSQRAGGSEGGSGVGMSLENGHGSSGEAGTEEEDSGEEEEEMVTASQDSDSEDSESDSS